MINTFEEKLAYEIGVKLAHQDYLEKEASAAAFRAFGSGLKGVATGQGGSIGRSFELGAKASKGRYAGPMNFRGVASEIGKGLAKPWQQLYSKGVAQRHQRIGQQAADKVRATGDTMRAAKGKAKDAARTEYQAAQKARDAAKANRETAFGSQKAYNQAHSNRILTKQDGTLNWGNIGTMATGAGLAGTGAYMAGNAAFGGGNTYNYNPVQPQVAPHQYYMNQMSNWFK
jgi:hypothetical protein